jgi:hypothetical protein
VTNAPIAVDPDQRISDRKSLKKTLMIANATFTGSSTSVTNREIIGRT